MRIGIDALFVIPGFSGGIETYARNLVAGLAGLDRSLELVVFVRPSAVDHGWGPAPRVRLVPVSVPEVHGGAFAAVQAWLPVLARRYRLDVLHHTFCYATLAWSRAQLVTIHDLITHDYYHREHDLVHRPLRARVRRGVFVRGARGATRVITPTATVAEEVASSLGVDRWRISVTHEAAKSPAEVRDSDARLARLGLRDGGFVFTVSRFLPHKNLETLVRAHLRSGIDRDLAIAGVAQFPDNAQPVIESIRREIAESPRGDRIKLLGHVAESDLAALYRGASAFAFPSLMEGFGLPPLEAMHAGTPVLASDIPVHREVLRDGALFVAPRDIDGMARALERICEDQALRQQLAASSRRVVDGYSWARTARDTFDAYRAALATVGRTGHARAA
ncbi:MAG TPA: glycosyltransferase family 1 protein [Kofleriaceae bacterium]|nr:glycosyltransferase family 1 protein [Kofleriaceae bacterium]